MNIFLSCGGLWINTCRKFQRRRCCGCVIRTVCGVCHYLIWDATVKPYLIHTILLISSISTGRYKTESSQKGAHLKLWVWLYLKAWSKISCAGMRSAFENLSHKHMTTSLPESSFYHDHRWCWFCACDLLMVGYSCRSVVVESFLSGGREIHLLYVCLSATFSFYIRL